MVAIVQLAIIFGATVGRVIYDLQGYQATFCISAAMLVVSAALAVLAA